MEENIIAPDMQRFINANRAGLIRWVLKKYPNAVVGDDQLEEFIYNEQELYRWAVSEGVDI